MKTKNASDLTFALCDIADEADAAGPGPHGAEGAERARGVQRAIAKAEEMHHGIIREARAKALEEAAEECEADALNAQSECQKYSDAADAGDNERAEDDRDTARFWSITYRVHRARASKLRDRADRERTR